MIAIVTQCATIHKDHTVVPANQDFLVTEKTAALVRNDNTNHLLIKFREFQTLTLLKPVVLLKIQMTYYKLIFHAIVF